MSNIQPYIILNDIDSRTISGLLISSLPPISKPQVRTQVETVDGRDGDLVTPLGFSAYDKVITIGLTYGYDIDDVIEYFNSEGIVVFSNEPDKFYRYAIYEQIDFDKLIRFKKAEVTLHCQPFKFSTTEAPIVRNGSGSISINVDNSGNIYSRPELLLTGSGNATVDLNSSEILSVDLDSANGAIFIDSENMNAYGAKSAINNVIAYINAYQDGEGDPSPSNERTIHGFTELNIVDTPDSNLTELNTIDNNFKGVVNFNQLINENLSHGGTNNAIKSYDLTTEDTEVTPINYSNAAGLYQTRLYQEDHIYLSIGDIRPDNRGQFLFGIEGASIITRIIEGGIYTRIYNLAKATATPQSLIVYYYPRGSQGIIWSSGGFKLKNVNVFDLTQLFGDTIANYIYDLEQSHAGDGVAFFRNLYPNDYYDYNTGTRELMPLTEKTVYTVDISENPQDPDNPQVIYGGYYESKTGLLNITYGIADLGSLNYTYEQGTPNVFRATLPSSPKLQGNLISSIYVGITSSVANLQDYQAIISGTAAYPFLRIRNDDYTDAASFKTAMSGKQLCYELADPIQIQLAPTQINNLIGLNQVFTDTNGDVAVDYRASGEAHFEQAPIVSFTCTFEDIIKGTLLNRAVTGNYDNIKLNIGLNNLVVNGSGVKQLAIDKYSRWL